jgi:signal transduction histidine kinase
MTPTLAAAVLIGTAAAARRQFAESAAAVAATAIDNARRDRGVQVRIEELRRLRRGLLDAADEELRQLEVELRSGPLRVGALSEAAARSPVPIIVESTLGEAHLPPAVALTAYHVATEALANVVKHAHAEHARIEVSANARQLSVRVVDDGVGAADQAGAGLHGLRERVQAVDGELQITNAPGAGTVVHASLPFGGG